MSMNTPVQSPKKFAKPKTPTRTPLASITNVLPQSTPRKSVTGNCFICGKSPSGQLRNVVPNTALPNVSPVLSAIEETFGVELESDGKKSWKICLTCKGRLDKASALKEQLVQALSKEENNSSLNDSLVCIPLASTPRQDDRVKRMLPSDLTPSPIQRPRKNRQSRSSLSFDIVGDGNNNSKPEHSYSRKLSLSDEAMSTRRQSFVCLRSFIEGHEMDTSEVSKLNSALKDGSSNHVAKVICTECPDLLKSIQASLVNDINCIANHLCSKTVEPGPSVLRTFASPETLCEKDLLSEALVELKRTMPFVLDVLMALCNPPDSEKPYSHFTVAMIYGMAMHSRNNQLCAVQKMNTASAVRLHCNNDLLDIFNKIGVTLSASSKLQFLDQLGQFNMDGVLKSIRKGVPGKLTMDNIDGMLMARQVRLGSGNKHYHYTASTYYPDRVDAGHLSMKAPSNTENLPHDVFFVSEAEKTAMLKNYGYLVSIVKSCD